MKQAHLKAAAAILAVLAMMFALVGCSSTGGSTGYGSGSNGSGNMMGGSNNAKPPNGSGY
jgi:hypothetical protein